MKKRVKGLVFLLSAILVFSFISASFTVGDTSNSIHDKYGPGSTLRGWINIGFDEEPSDSVFESSFENSGGEIGLSTATLMTLLEGDNNYDYTCNPLTCVSNYEAANEEPGKTLNLAAGESAIIGFKLSETASIKGISSFSMSVSSDAPQADVPQLSIDILNNDDKEWETHTAAVGAFGAADFGCFDSADSDDTAFMVSTEYCERVQVLASPAVEIGANLIGVDPVDFDVSIESFSGDEYGSCVATSVGAIGDPVPEAVSCVPDNFAVDEDKEYVVCIKTSDSADDLKYEINSEETEPCGFSGNFNGYDIDFEIFAKSGQYAPITPFVLDTAELTLIDGDITDIEPYIENYLSLSYDNDCSNDCIIPLEITAAVDQQITISNPVLGYESNAVKTENNLYDLTETPASITAGVQALKIDSGKFLVPSDFGNKNISLSLEGEEIFTENISIERVPTIKFLNTMTTTANYSTRFVVRIESEKNISSYEWHFGNGDTTNTTINETTYTYDALGNYDLRIKVVDIDGGTSIKIFNIIVGSASEIIGPILEEKQAGLGIIKAQLVDLSDFEIDIINQTLNIGAIESDLNTAEIRNSIATTEDDYQTILRLLQDIEVPELVYQSSVANSWTFFPLEREINVGVLADITEEDYKGSKEDSYAEAILGWNVQNIDMTITYKEMTSVSGDYRDPFLKFFEIDITKKSGFEGDAYIILEDVEGLTFDGAGITDEQSGYLYTPFIEESKKIIFSTTEDVNFIDLPLFVAPEISELSVVDFEWSPLQEDGKLKRWTLFVLIIVLLIMVGIAFWIILQTWYRRKYENYLFKNKNNLYNLFTWIENAKKKGLTDKDIRLKLSNVGWTSEQLRYAMRKHAGKRTGMAEIPIKKLEGKSVPQGRIPGNGSNANPK